MRHILRGILYLTLTSWSGCIAVTATTGQDSLGAVSSESKICSEIGIELLKRGVSYDIFAGLPE